MNVAHSRQMTMINPGTYHIVLICSLGYFQDSLQEKSWPSKGILLFGMNKQQIEHVGNESRKWMVQESAFNENHAVLFLIDNATLSTPEKLCMGCLSLPGDLENGTCENMDHTCFVYYKGNTCNQNDLREKIKKQKIECRNISYHSVVNDIELRYRALSTSINYQLPAFQMIYKQIKCEDERNAATTPLERNFKIGGGKSGTNDQDVPTNSDDKPLSAEKTAIAIAAAIIGSITILLIALTIIRREKSNRRHASTIELDNTAKDGAERDNELYSPNSQFGDELERKNLKGSYDTRESPYSRV